MTTMKTSKKLLRSIQEQLELLPESYRFLYGPPETLNASCFFVGLNPGGSDEDIRDLYVDEGNAFLNEHWNASGTDTNPYQKQVLTLFQNLATHLGISDWKSYMTNQWMLSNYVFYRSDRWESMASKKNHISISSGIWKQIFTHTTPKVIFANGHTTYDSMKKVLESMGWSVESETKSQRAWDGPHIMTLQNNNAKCLLVGFAHLSTFKIVGRENNKECLDYIYSLVKETLQT
jgi:hypothetical protein